MSDHIGCLDNSCLFKQLRPGGVGTNGGCRCFENLISWLPAENRWNREEVRKVQQDTQRLAGELRRSREVATRLRKALEKECLQRSAERTWCTICRTEQPPDSTGHRHSELCVLFEVLP